MAKEFKIFFSWQSDLSANQTTRFIEESIEIAQTLLPDSIILVPDEATRNRFEITRLQKAFQAVAVRIEKFFKVDPSEISVAVRECVIANDK